MSLKKQYLKTKPVCKVTFRLPAEAAGEAECVSVVGDFNNWDLDATPMKRKRDGSFEAVAGLEKGFEYQFRYLIDQCRWENDWDADKYIPSPFGDTENSVVCV